MVAGGIVHTEWLNENRNRRYPFFDGVTLRDLTNSMIVPNELIVDLNFPVHALSYDVAQFYLKTLTVFAGGIVVTIGYQGTSIATRSITEAEHSENKSYYIEGTGDFSDSVGRISIGRFDAIKEFGGTYHFDATTARLLPTVLRPSLRGVTGMRVVTAENELSELLQNDVEFLAGDNIQLAISEPTPGVKRIKISAVNNPAFSADCDCPDDTTGEPIKTFNGFGPDPTGNFDLTSISGCLTINSQTGLIELEDTCAEPCCGCEELDVLRSELERLGSQVATQRAFAQRAMSSIEQLRDVVLASKFGSTVPC